MSPNIHLLRERVRKEQPSPRLTLTFVERPHVLVGHGAAAWEAMSRLLGPVEGSRRCLAHTRWRVRWSYRASRRDEGVGVSETLVRLEALTRVPVWRPHRGASRSLLDAWDEWSGALVAHEQRHLEHGVEAAHGVLDALERLTPAPDEQALAGMARRQIDAILEAARDKDHALDEAPR